MPGGKNPKKQINQEIDVIFRFNNDCTVNIRFYDLYSSKWAISKDKFPYSIHLLFINTSLCHKLKTYQISVDLMSFFLSFFHCFPILYLKRTPKPFF